MATNVPVPPSYAQSQSSQHPAQMTDTDPLVKYQTLLPILKESVVNLFRHTILILQNTSNGQCRQTDMQMLNKCMEDFYNISDQVHHWLVLAESTVDQYLMGELFSKEVTSTFNTGNIPAKQESKPKKDVLFYSQYLANAKKQVTATARLRAELSEFADGLQTGSNS